MDQVLKIMRRNIQDEVNQRANVDSDDEIKDKELRQFNEQIVYINKCDEERFKSETKE